MEKLERGHNVSEEEGRVEKLCLCPMQHLALTECICIMMMMMMMIELEKYMYVPNIALLT